MVRRFCWENAENLERVMSNEIRFLHEDVKQVLVVYT
ncbi:hypothetical protein L1278_003396 [Pontibacter sp. HSC-36F09]|nr:hypothetical protein [Pontibacter sp. HSC-36F09]